MSSLESLRFKDQESLDKVIQEIEKFKISPPGNGTLVTGPYLQENLEILSLARDTILMYERFLVKDLSNLKALLRVKKSTYKNKLNAIIMANEQKVSYIAKRTHAENMSSAESSELADIEAFKDVLEGYLDYINNRKAEVKQQNSDLKLLYKAFLLDNPKPKKPVDPFKTSKVPNPWKDDQGAVVGGNEEEDDLDLDKYLSVNINL